MFERNKVKALFRELGAESNNALEALYDLCARTLYGYAFVQLRNREDAEDVVQEVFVKMMKTRTALKDVKNPQAYLLSIAHRTVVDIWRKRSEHSYEDEIIDTREDERVSLPEKTAVNQAMAALSPEQRAAVYLREIEGMSFKETARVMNTNIFTAASRCRLGLKRLKKLLEVSE